MNFVILLVALALGILRVAGVTSPLFQGLAHVFVGGLGGAWLYWMCSKVYPDPLCGEVYPDHIVPRGNAGRLYGVLFVALTVLEVACFLLLR